jgi:hypothetical protein
MSGGEYSEVTALRNTIASEIEAMNRALYEYATVGSHCIIDNKYSKLGEYQCKLANLVGRQESLDIVMHELNNHIEDHY